MLLGPRKAVEVSSLGPAGGSTAPPGLPGASQSGRGRSAAAAPGAPQGLSVRGKIAVGEDEIRGKVRLSPRL